MCVRRDLCLLFIPGNMGRLCILNCITQLLKTLPVTDASGEVMQTGAASLYCILSKKWHDESLP